MPITAPETFHNVTWAIDPFSDSARLPIQAARTIRSLVESMGAKVEPVAVLNVWMPSTKAPRRPYRSGGKISPEVEKKLKKFLHRIRFPGIRPARVLISYSNSLHASVKTLLDHARRDGSELIVVGTHARKGVPRLFFGSFAETLVLCSPLPVLVINPEADCPPKMQRILFSTDFSQASRKAFEKTVEITRVLGARLLLFHCVESLYPGPGAPPIPATMMKEFIKVRSQQGMDWLKYAQSRGVKGDFRLSRATVPVTEAILTTAKRFEASLIALASQSGAVSSTLWGSITRQLIRSSDCPVLVIHPPKKAAT